MTQTNHTPGPWAFRMTGWQTNPAAIYSPRRPGAVACIPARTSVPLDEQSANARLIAAAPDLLETLEYVLLAADYDGALTMGTAALSPAIRDRIVRSIAQAKGE